MTPKELKNKKLLDSFNALIGLLKEKKLTAISVTEFCVTAQVSRTYYYHNFSSFEDIISQYEILSIIQYMRGLPNKIHLTVATMLTHYFQLAANAADAQLVLINNGKESVLINAFTTAYLYLLKNDIILKSSHKRLEQKYWAEFMAGAVINMSVRWLQEGMPETPEYMGKLVAAFVHSK
ncbi:transcriptional regulator [Loigolactobacillus backii]|uniref:TetR-like C-terminal domain-containing protein n=1 Tax=Loigolactobacillus backii TaxID=375175 RepID=UPI0007F13CC3|nr:TetR-like C-terminal domain-containing protein [Loigolactobacillus backii]ANK60910.1 transcriptional regulator [Loigolactobacillus backii]ANK65867.1 transcriptional regulator [Loigolactobacillus backii]ANK67192.1 transcriptional regulator [Loigolactobacillus backii]OLF69444.1 transcriptional regulator [Loigolactobacillus backii]PIO87836.1 transcriptional regulator [Loigolactobacillus backii]